MSGINFDLPSHLTVRVPPLAVVLHDNGNYFKPKISNRFIML